MIAALSGLAPTAHAAPPSRDGGLLLDRLVGTLNAENAWDVLSNVRAHEDRVLGLKVEASIGGETRAPHRYSADRSDTLLTITSQSPERGNGIAITIPNGHYRWEHAHYVIDGFFLVKEAGTYGGIRQEALLPIDEASIRLRPEIEIRDQATSLPGR